VIVVNDVVGVKEVEASNLVALPVTPTEAPR